MVARLSSREGDENGHHPVLTYSEHKQRTTLVDKITCILGHLISSQWRAEVIVSRLYAIVLAC